jgi:hypothetical protein
MKNDAAVNSRPSSPDFDAVTGSSGAREAVAAFLEGLGSCGSAVTIETLSEKGCPGFRIPSRRLTFLGAPGKREEGLLADFLRAEKSGGTFAEAMTVPAGLRLFVSGNCPHCPGALRLALGFLENPNLSLEVVNVDFCPDMATAWGVMAVPVLMLQGDEENFRWTGVLRAQNIAQALCSREPESLSEESLLNILESGEAQRLVRMMQSRECIFPAFYALLTHEKWTVRLGAMVAAESLIQAAPDLGEDLLESLWALRETLDVVVMGDMIYLMGFGKPGVWRPRLTCLLETSREQLGEALEEALESLGAAP